jgi:hypothetical protein
VGELVLVVVMAAVVGSVIVVLEDELLELEDVLAVIWLVALVIILSFETNIAQVHLGHRFEE